MSEAEPIGGTGALPAVEGVSFRTVPGMGGYAVGDDGTVWSPFTRRGYRKHGWWPVATLRRPYGAGYAVVCLRADGGKGKVLQRYVHRLVLEAFVGPPTPGQVCRHLDGHATNNKLANLRWGTAAENAHDKLLHGTHHRGVGSCLATVSKPEIVAMFLLKASGKTNKEIATVIGCGRSTVGCVLSGKTFQFESAELRAARSWIAARPSATTDASREMIADGVLDLCHA